MSNEFFIKLLKYEFEPVKGYKGYKAKGEDYYIRGTDKALVEDPVMNAVVQEFAADNKRFLKVFAYAWTKLMNADRFDGPRGNLCSGLYDNYMDYEEDKMKQKLESIDDKFEFPNPFGKDS